MAFTLLNGTGNLICDGVDFSIAIPDDDQDATKRGEAWGNKEAFTAAINVTKTELAVPEPDGLLLLDRDGGALFTVL